MAEQFHGDWMIADLDMPSDQVLAVARLPQFMYEDEEET